MASSAEVVGAEAGGDGGLDDLAVGGGLLHGGAGGGGQVEDEVEVLAGQVEAEGDRGLAGVLEGLALVVDERGGDGAGGEHLVGGLAGHPGPLGQDQALGQGQVEAVQDRVHGQLHHRPRPEVADVEDLLGQGVEDRADPLQDGRVAAGHDGELAGLDRGHAAGDGRVEQEGPAVGDQRPEAVHGARVDGAGLADDRVRLEAGHDPVAAGVGGPDGGVVGQGAEHHLGAGGGLAGGGGHRSPRWPRRPPRPWPGSG